MSENDDDPLNPSVGNASPADAENLSQLDDTEPPSPPAGQTYLTGADEAFLCGADGAWLLGVL